MHGEKMTLGWVLEAGGAEGGMGMGGMGMGLGGNGIHTGINTGANTPGSGMGRGLHPSYLLSLQRAMHTEAKLWVAARGAEVEAEATEVGGVYVVYMWFICGLYLVYMCLLDGDHKSSIPYTIAHTPI